MASNSAKNSADKDGQIAYHNEMEHITNKAGEVEQVHNTSDRLSHEDNKVAGTIAEKEILPE